METIPSSRGIVALFKRISLVGVPAGSLRHLRLFLFGFLSRHKSAKPQRFFKTEKQCRGFSKKLSVKFRVFHGLEKFVHHARAVWESRRNLQFSVFNSRPDAACALALLVCQLRFRVKCLLKIHGFYLIYFNYLIKKYFTFGELSDRFEESWVR